MAPAQKFYSARLLGKMLMYTDRKDYRIINQNAHAKRKNGLVKRKGLLSRLGSFIDVIMILIVWGDIRGASVKSVMNGRMTQMDVKKQLMVR